jgi:hypothetical protein
MKWSCTVNGNYINGDDGSNVFAPVVLDTTRFGGANPLGHEGVSQMTGGFVVTAVRPWDPGDGEGCAPGACINDMAPAIPGGAH